MKLSAARESYYSHSGSASSAARQIAFAGVAVIWVFNQPQSDLPIHLPVPLGWALLFLCVSLAMDLLQYTTSAAIWGLYSRHQEKKFRHRFHEDPDIEPPAIVNWPGIGFFWGKLTTLLAAYVVIASYLFGFLVK